MTEHAQVDHRKYFKLCYIDQLPVVNLKVYSVFVMEGTKENIYCFVVELTL